MAVLHIDYHAVLDAARRHTDHCPLCGMIEEAERAYWDSVLFSQVGTEGFQDQFLSTDGFCSRHADELAAHNDGTAMTMLYAPLMRHRLAWIEERRTLAGRTRRWLRRRKEHPAVKRGRAADRADCPLCQRVDHWAERFLINLLRHQSDRPLREAIEAGSGLCLPHYQRLVALAHRGPIRRIFSAGGGRVPREARWLRKFHDSVYERVLLDAAEYAHSPGGTRWRRLMHAMEGGTRWDAPSD